MYHLTKDQNLQRRGGNNFALCQDTKRILWRTHSQEIKKEDIQRRDILMGGFFINKKLKKKKKMPQTLDDISDVGADMIFKVPNWVLQMTPS